MDKRELKWQTEDDVRIIRNYSELINDKERYDKAVKEIKKQQMSIAKVLENKKGGK